MLENLYEARHNVDMDMFITDIQIRNEFMRRNFTKRQMNILVFIYSYSFGFGKRWALIPKMKNFEICGVSSIKIRKELELLVDMFIIDWNQEENLFRIKDTKDWLAPTISSFSHDTSQDIFNLNLKHGNIYP